MNEQLDSQLSHVRDASEEAPSHDGSADEADTTNEPAPTDEEIHRLRAERDALEAEREANAQAAATLLAEEARRAEVTALRKRVADLLRERDGSAGVAPALRTRSRPAASESPRYETPTTESTEVVPSESISQHGGYTPAADTGRIRFRDPKPYKGESLKEATMFIKGLKTRFKLDRRAFATDEKKVLYGVTWLSGDPETTWAEGGDDDATWEEFETFVFDCVADPVNRSLDVGQDYEEARQKEGETVSAFAMHLSTLESQFHDSYTEEQRTRHLFNKLRNNIREAITLKADVPLTRRELIAMAGRYENAQKPRKHHRSITDDRRGRDGGGPSKKQKTRKDASSQGQQGRSGEDKSSKPPSDQRKITCYNCGKEGHKSSDCRSPPKNGSAPHATRKVGVTEAPNGSMAPPSRKPSKKGKGQAAGARFSLT
jgi:hypothetical protein